MGRSLHVVSFDVVECYKCGVPFGMPEHLNKLCLEEQGRAFYCPNGHGQHYTESENRRLRGQLEQAKEAREAYRRLYETSDRSRRALRGHLTRVKRRVASGKCPCCSKLFPDLSRHMRDVHPGYENPGGEEEG